MLVQATQNGYMDNRIIKGPTPEGAPGEVFTIPDTPKVKRKNPKTKQLEEVPEKLSFLWMKQVAKKPEKPVAVYTEADIEKLLKKAKTNADKEAVQALLGQPKK